VSKSSYQNGISTKQSVTVENENENTSSHSVALWESASSKRKKLDYLFRRRLLKAVYV
jgi:hypothetical protein